MSAGTVQGLSQLGGFSALGVSDAPSSYGGYVHNAVASALVGGSAAVLGGGKFTNGALTGTFSRLFNDLGSDLRDGNVHIERSRIENINKVSEWSTAFSVGDVGATVLQRIPHPWSQTAGYALDMIDIMSVQSRVVTSGQAIITETYSYDTLYDTRGYPNDSSRWKEVPGFRSEQGRLVSSRRRQIFSKTKIEHRICLAQSSGCTP